MKITIEFNKEEVINWLKGELSHEINDLSGRGISGNQCADIPVGVGNRGADNLAGSHFSGGLSNDDNIRSHSFSGGGLSSVAAVAPLGNNTVNMVNPVGIGGALNNETFSHSDFGTPVNGLSSVSTGSPVDTPAHVSDMSGIERDRWGLPWDGRIHSSSRAKIADGGWRMRRGVPENVVAQVTAELRDKWKMTAPAPVEMLPPAPAPPAPAPPAPAPPAPAPPAPAPPAPAPPAPAPPAPAPPAPPVNPDNVRNLVVAITRQGIAPDKVAEACQQVGLSGFPGLINRPEMAQAVAMILGVTI